MSRDVRAKLAAGHELDELDIVWARQMGIELPPKYDGIREPEEPKEADSGSVAPQGSADDVDLDSLTKAELMGIGEQQGVELNMGMTKSDMIEKLSQES